MSKQSHAQVDRITALENELLVIKNELLNLQSARSVRTAKFIKNLLRSKPKDLPIILKDLPALLTKITYPSIEKTVHSTQPQFNSLYKPLPLYQYPNITVATIGSDAAKLFNFCCNTVELGGMAYKSLANYDAVALIALTAADYNQQFHKDLLDELLKKNPAVKIIVLYHSQTETKILLKHFNPDSLVLVPFDFTQPGSLRSYVDIYQLDMHKVGVEGFKNIFVSAKLHDYSFPGVTSTLLSTPYSAALKDNALVIIDEGDLLTVGTSAQESIATIIDLIAKGVPVLIRADRQPTWLDSPILVRQTTKQLDSRLKELREPYQLERYAVQCRRSMILTYNALASVTDLLHRAGIIPKASPSIPTISVILASKRPQFIKQALQQLAEQTIQPHQVLLAMHGFNEDKIKQTMAIVKDSKLKIDLIDCRSPLVFGEVLNAALDQATGEFITKIDDDDYYGSNHLLDLYVAHLHSGADIVGKWSNWVYLKSEDRTICWIPEYANSYGVHVPGGTIFLKTATLKNLRFAPIAQAIDSELNKRALARGATIYSTHRYNYIRVRDVDHTYKTTNADFKSRAHKISLEGLPLKDTLTV